MNFERNESNENYIETVVIPPATESLFDIHADYSPWPENLKGDKKLEKEVFERKRVLESFNRISNKTPADMSVETQLESGMTTEEEIITLYDNFSHLLESDPLSSRAILYFPFELIPHKDWKPTSYEIKRSADRFMDSYIESWHSLLNTEDVRANFVDGDVLEYELRTKPLERVTKAAHLIPILLERKIIDKSDVFDLLRQNLNTTLENSVVDTLPILVDLELITKEELDTLIKENNIRLEYRDKDEIPEDKVSEARAKWLKEKDLPVEIPENADKLINKPFTEKENALEEDIHYVSEIIKSIETDPELSEIIFPVGILFGSKIKGYGAVDADIDIAVFVKPGARQEEKEKYRSLLAKHFSTEKIHGKVIEFWLESTADKELNIIDDPTIGTYAGDSRWAHVLFEGAWIGNKDMIHEIHEKLLSHYLYCDKDNQNDLEKRKIWLEEMERDTLQYRLMHKGYARLFHPIGGIHTEHSDKIDGSSVFYDSGFRRLATELYLRKVFLPQLDK